MLKISTKFDAALRSFCENQNSVQDQDQDHDITLDFIHTLERRLLGRRLLGLTI